MIELCYKPKKMQARKKLVEIFLQAEDGYFSQWSKEHLGRLPGEFKLSNLWGTSPGAATYLMEPYLDANGRQEYKKVLLAILERLKEDKYSQVLFNSI